MMRLKKGTKVEVFSRKDASIGSWRCGDIISGNGYSYNVKFDWFPLTNEIPLGAVERVPRKAIRPCPPPVCRTNNWVRGDLVEVFHNLSWKNATIVKNIGANNFVVGLVGSSQDFIVHQTHLRVRQSWDDGKWFLVGKGSANGNISAKRISTDARRKLNTRVDCSAEKKIEIKKHNTVFLKKRKMGSPLFGLSSVAVAKKRMVEDGCGQRNILTHLSVVPDETSSVYPQELLGKKCFMSHISDVDSGYGNANPVDTVSCASSVGSCSTNTSYVHNFQFYDKKQSSNDDESYCSDAESSSLWEYEEGSSILKSDKFVEDAHGSELHAYRCIIESLYALGPLSWEEEEKVTNLRHSLHISNDEHLTEIRNLISADIRPLH